MHENDGEIPKGIDPMLLQLVNVVQGSDGRVPITLNSGGILVSGILVSSERYFSEFADHLSSATVQPSRGTREDAETAVLQWAELYKTHAPKMVEFQHRDFIHLIHVRFVDSSGIFPSTGYAPPWRCRLDRVDGFFIGIVGKE